MEFEIAAGGIVLRQAQDKSTKKPKWQVLLVQHSSHHGWVFPKGLVDPGENLEKTALREVKEEGGVEAKTINKLPPTQYIYQLQGKKINKKVIYFLMEYISGNIADHDWEMEDAQWLPLEKVTERLTYKTDKEIFQKAKKDIEKK